MDPAASDQCTVFEGTKRIASGPPEAVLAAARRAAEAGGRVQAFDDATGRMLEFDLRPDGSPPVARGRGRPKLGVTAREVTLLPRHWDWLAAQPGGASIALRKLVEAARKAPAERARAGQEAAYRFMTATAGDLAGYEAATRALFAGDRAGLVEAAAAWPADLRDHALGLAGAALTPRRAPLNRVAAQTSIQPERGGDMERASIGRLIAARLQAAQTGLAQAYARSGPIGYFAVDDVLPDDLARAVAAAFPERGELVEKNTARERKLVSSQMDRHAPLIEEALFAFQAPEVLAAVQSIIGRVDLHADPMLYAGGVSRMEVGGYLNPHIDNSHDKERRRWRALNLLYYVSPDWRAHYGGNLELWPNGVRDAPLTIESRFNRLVVMATHQRSWHSVSPIRVDQARNCISNYYFADHPMRDDQPFHVTSFRGRPERPATDLLLRADAGLRGLIRKLKPGGAFKTGHWYAKGGTDELK